jgi:hypothetical protein
MNSYMQWKCNGLKLLIEWFKKRKTTMLGHGMARMAICVSGQHQTHGALLAVEIAKWLLRFCCNPLTPNNPDPCTTRDTIQTLFPSHRRLCCNCRAVVAVAATITGIVPSPSPLLSPVVLVLLPPPLTCLLLLL